MYEKKTPVESFRMILERLPILIQLRTQSKNTALLISF